MDLAHVEDLVNRGCFRDAVASLDNVRNEPRHVRQLRTLQAIVFERFGQFEKARAAVAALQRVNEIGDSHRAACEYVLGRLCLEAGQTEKGITHLQRASTLADRANDLNRLVWSHIALFPLVADRSGPDAAIPIITEARIAATRSGDIQLTAALHMFLGELEGKRGLLTVAERHVRLAQSLLSSTPNPWLEAVGENILLAVGIVRSDFDAALQHGMRALELADKSGVATIRRACLGNLGNLFQAKGNLTEAIGYLERSATVVDSTNEKTNACLESLAQIYLLNGNPDRCSELLSQIEGSIRHSKDRVLYAHRYSELTKCHLFQYSDQLDRALAKIEEVLELAEQSQDVLLLKRAMLVKADLLQQSGRLEGSVQAATKAILGLGVEAPDLFGYYEQVLASASVREGSRSEAEQHHERAKRLFVTLSSKPALQKLDQARKKDEGLWSGTSNREEHPTVAAHRNLTHEIAALFTYSSRPELVAQEVAHILKITDCAHEIVPVERKSDSVLTPISPDEKSPLILGLVPADQRILSVGQVGDRKIEIHVRTKPDVESIATVNAIEVLLATLTDLERARAEREERATLWPVDELPTEDGRAIATGHMRELMAQARRVAAANVSVLITGESGTGKEVVARAIHSFSARAAKPFVPFNCTAVPRDLLESQLFGFRRGAFTGAERDNAGVIRAARDGTLFLDEIGELGLDLQPKLLRFLESGEISPLGEPRPLNVSVRILAATNTNLEQAVRDGRFREDLFYRLNVIRLSIRPLRERRDEIPGLISHFLGRALEEFRKSQIRLTDEAVERLVLYTWPGNVRQLNNEIRRVIALAEPGSVIGPGLIAREILDATEPRIVATGTNGREIAVPLTEKLMPTLSRIECEMIKVALRESHGRLDLAAKSLGISRKGLYLKRQRLGL